MGTPTEYGDARMVHVVEGSLNAEGYQFALVVSRFNNLITDHLVEGAVDCLKRHGAKETAITIIKVPGAFEIPQAARRALEMDAFDAVVCIGAVIRGGTPHFDYVAAEVAKGVASLAGAQSKPVTLGVLTCDTLEQAIDRAGAKSGNKGWEAALHAVELLNLYKEL